MKRITILVFITIGLVACEAIVEVDDISEEVVTVLAPVNNTVLDTIAVTFSWEPIEAAETYHIQVATPNFENAQQIEKDSTLIKTQFSTTLSKTKYEWRVRAENSGYVTNYTTQQFTIEK